MIICYAKVMPSCYVTSQHIQELLGAFFKINRNAEFNIEQDYLCEDRIKKSDPQDRAPFGIMRHAKP